jgi:hypothetical protein
MLRPDRPARINWSDLEVDLRGFAVHGHFSPDTMISGAGGRVHSAE